MNKLYLSESSKSIKQFITDVTNLLESEQIMTHDKNNDTGWWVRTRYRSRVTLPFNMKS
jgi:hypothetical protein